MILTIAIGFLCAQNNVGINTNQPHQSAALEVSSTNKGFLTPRMNSSQRKAIINPANGLLVYDMERQALYMYNGSKWNPFVMLDEEANAVLNKKQASDGIAEDYFGYKVAMDGDYAAVAASHAEVNNNQNQGVVYVFHKINGEWLQEAKLYASDGSAFEYFGQNIAMHGNHLVVGLSKKYVYVFERNGNVWTQQQKVEPLDPQNANEFGQAIDIEGDKIVVGAKYGITSNVAKGQAYIFTLNNGIWAQSQKLIAPDGMANDKFGTAVVIHNDTIVVGASGASINGVVNTGCLYAYAKVGSFFAFHQKIFPTYPQANYELGASVDFYGNMMVSGAINGGDFGEGVVYSFRKNASNVWVYGEQINIPSGMTRVGYENFGQSLCIKDNHLFIGYPLSTNELYHSGYVYEYVVENTYIKIKRRIADPNANYSEFLGSSIATNGTDFIMGAHGYKAFKGKTLFATIEN